METDKRIETHIPCLDIFAKVKSNNKNQRVKVVNISRGGACIDQKIDPILPARITIFRNTPQSSCHIKNRECQIIEHRNKPHTGIQFVNRLTQDEIDILGLPKKETLDFAKMDYDQVHRETMDIKSCRTNIFVAVLSVLGAIGIAIIGLKINQAFNRWLFLASLLPLLLLTAAILSTFHKARGLNRRLGYLEALGEYLSGGKTPQYWRGWPKAQRVSEKCLCDFKKDGEQTCLKQEQCKEKAKKNAIRLEKYLSPRPHLLKNFTSLTGHCYFTAYLITVICSIYALFTTLNVRYGISFQDFYKPCLAGLLGGLMVSFLNRLDKSKVKDVFYGIAISLLIVSPIVLSLLAAFENQHKWAIYSSYIFGTIFFVFIIYIGNVLVEQSKNINIGRYSTERFYQIWKYRMCNCIYMCR